MKLTANPRMTRIIENRGVVHMLHEKDGLLVLCDYGNDSGETVGVYCSVDRRHLVPHPYCAFLSKK